LRNYYNTNIHTERSEEGFETKFSIAFGAHCVDITIIDGLTRSYYRLKVVDSYGKNVTGEFLTEYGPVEHISCDNMTHALQITNRLVQQSFAVYQR
jgi:hypothetical protein